MANGFQVDFLMAGVMGTNNKPLAYGKVYCYSAGGSDLQSVYTDSNMTIAATNPIILDERGSANVYARGYFKFIIKDKNDVTIETYDNLYYVVPETEVTDVVSVDDDYTATAFNEVIAVNTASGNVEIKLPSANGQESLRKLIYRSSSGSNTLTVTPDGSDTINGASSYTITSQYGFIELISDNADWLIINSNISSGTITTDSSSTLSNKSLVDSSTYFVDNADGTKRLQFQLSGITTGNDHTLTFNQGGIVLYGSSLSRSIENDNISITPGATPATNAHIIIYGHSHASYPDNLYINGNVFIEVEDWTAMTLLTGWANSSVSWACEYMKDPFGFVHLRGRAISSSGTYQNIFQLPDGYKPDQNIGVFAHLFLATGDLQTVNVETNGYIAVSGSVGYNDLVYLDAIPPFKAA